MERAAQKLRLQILLQAVEDALEARAGCDANDALADRTRLHQLRANLLQELAEAETQPCGREQTR